MGNDYNDLVRGIAILIMAGAAIWAIRQVSEPLFRIAESLEEIKGLLMKRNEQP